MGAGARRRGTAIAGAALVLASMSNPSAGSAAAPPVPPYDGTIFLDPDIITPDDPNAYASLTYTGQGERTVYDRRTESFNTISVYLFDVDYEGGQVIEADVNAEFGNQAAAEAAAERFGTAVGLLPPGLRRDVDQLWIHDGDALFGGGNRSLLLYTDQADAYDAGGILEEALVHEATHTSMDGRYSQLAGWLRAQEGDPTFISTYARDNPDREDMAESYLTYIAVRYRAHRISQDLTDTVRSVMPRRMRFFDRLPIDLTGLAPLDLTRSQAARDGWLRESLGRIRRGGVVAAGPELRVGRDDRGRELRSLTSFRTRGLPADAVLTRVRLVLTPLGAADRSILRSEPLSVTLRRGSFGKPDLEQRDFQRRGMRPFTARCRIVRSRCLVTLPARTWGAVRINGLTQLRLAGVGLPSGQVVRVAAGEAGGSAPKLELRFGRG